MSLGKDFFFKEETDPKYFEGLVTIVREEMGQDELEKFLCKEHVDCKILEDDLPLLKVFLIPAKEQGTCYMVGKIFHTIGDGLSVLQLFSLM